MSPLLIVFALLFILVIMANLDFIFDVVFASMEVTLWCTLAVAGLFIFTKLFKHFWMIT